MVVFPMLATRPPEQGGNDMRFLARHSPSKRDPFRDTLALAFTKTRIKRRLTVVSIADPKPKVHPIREFRLRREWSQRELSRRANLGESQISSFELGWMKPRPAQLKRLAKALGVRVEDLVN
jgi:ribosome-binding protein aMBF1 (putative translation factor)